MDNLRFGKPNQKTNNLFHHIEITPTTDSKKNLNVNFRSNQILQNILLLLYPQLQIDILRFGKPPKTIFEVYINNTSFPPLCDSLKSDFVSKYSMYKHKKF